MTVFIPAQGALCRFSITAPFSPTGGLDFAYAYHADEDCGPERGGFEGLRHAQRGCASEADDDLWKERSWQDDFVICAPLRVAR